MTTTLDGLIVGAGFSGIALACELKKRNCSFLITDSATSVGGTWFANRYPGARCDTPTVDYSFHNAPDFDATWEWSEDFATQPEILEYLQRYCVFQSLESHLRLNRKLQVLSWEEKKSQWHATFSDGTSITTRCVALALGALAKPSIPILPGQELFQGNQWHTAQWPRNNPSFENKTVAVIGTGASGIQIIPEIAKNCKTLYVLQRDTSLAMPANSNPQAFLNRRRTRKLQRQMFLAMLEKSQFGSSSPIPLAAGTSMSDAEIQARFDQAWQNSDLFALVGISTDLFTSQETNRRVEELFFNRVRSLTSTLTPSLSPFATKRICIERGYYEALRRKNVQLIHTLDHSLSLTQQALRCTPDLEKHHQKSLHSSLDYHSQPNSNTKTLQIDSLIYATGFEAFTGAILDVDVIGKSHTNLKDTWRDYPSNVLGILVPNFPNLFLMQGPGSPSVLTNMAQTAQVQARWITEMICNTLSLNSNATLECSVQQETDWRHHVQSLAQHTLFTKSRSWYRQTNQANPQGYFLPYIDGLPRYSKQCQALIAKLSQNTSSSIE